ncbi:alpha/beta hydrolase [Cereibacter sp. SYSU M97828]|nr:alpha/beta hydrolase [Cereibacter flavus]
MTLSAGARAVLALKSGAPFETMTAPEARAAFDAAWPLTQSPPEGPAAEPWEVAGLPALRWGSGLRTILYFHGGGWVVGSPRSHAGICQRLATACDATVIAPEYRLAPEHPFPAAQQDALACLRALRAGVIVAGDSAGGNLAAVTALCAARDATLPQPAAQLLYYPNTALGPYDRSPFATGFGLTADTMHWFRDQYRPDAADWRAKPLLGDPTGAAPAHVVLAGADILHDEGRAYADLLAAAGVDVQTDLWPGSLHGFLSMDRFDPAAAEAIAASAAFLDARGI